MQKPDIQQLIGNTLRRGVTLACVLAALGGLYYLIAHGADAVPDYRHFDPHTAAAQTDYTSLMGIVRGVAALNAHSCIQLGVVALLLTPILRVVLSLFDFTLERDWRYAAITAIVLAVIVVNSLGGCCSKRPSFAETAPFSTQRPLFSPANAPHTTGFCRAGRFSHNFICHRQKKCPNSQ